MIAQTKIDRRAFIAGMGASLALASVPSRDGYALAADATSADGGDPAYEAWESWRGEPADGPLALVRAAIVAANAHNTQPWFFRVQPSRIEVMSDTSRNIGTVDPLLREMHIGIGCALENLMLAAAAHGYACKLTLNENDPALAVAELTPAATAKPALFDAIGSRHTNRGAYDTTRAVDADVMNALQQLGDDDKVRVIWYSAPADRARFGDVIIQATEAFVADPDQSRDSARWLRNGTERDRGASRRSDDLHAGAFAVHGDCGAGHSRIGCARRSVLAVGHARAARRDGVGVRIDRGAGPSEQCVPNENRDAVAEDATVGDRARPGDAAAESTDRTR